MPPSSIVRANQERDRESEECGAVQLRENERSRGGLDREAREHELRREDQRERGDAKHDRDDTLHSALHDHATLRERPLACARRGVSWG